MEFTLRVIYRDSRKPFSEPVTLISSGRAANNDPIFTNKGREEVAIQMAIDDMNKKRREFEYEIATEKDVELLDVHTLL